MQRNFTMETLDLVIAKQKRTRSRQFPVSTLSSGNHPKNRKLGAGCEVEFLGNEQFAGGAGFSIPCRSLESRGKSTKATGSDGSFAWPGSHAQPQTELDVKIVEVDDLQLELDMLSYRLESGIPLGTKWEGLWNCQPKGLHH